MVCTEEICVRLRANDPELTVIRSYDIEDYDSNRLMELTDAAKHSHHLEWIYVDLDYVRMDGWAALASLVNISRSLEKLWMLNLRSEQRPRTEYISQFFAAMIPRAVSIKGFGLEMEEPDRTFGSLERPYISNFFAKNDTIEIVNILCERRGNGGELYNHHHNEGSSFLDCVLLGLARNTTVEHLILRHSNRSPGCWMQVQSQSIREFFRYNESVKTVGYMVGNNLAEAEGLGTSLKFNRKPRGLSLHNMSEAAAVGFFLHLPASNLRTLTLRECALARDDVLTTLNIGVRDCHDLRELDIDLIPEGQPVSHLDDILRSLGPAMSNHPSLKFFRIDSGRCLDQAGGAALGACLSSNRVLEDVFIGCDEVTDSGASALSAQFASIQQRSLQSLRLKCSVMSEQARQDFLEEPGQNTNFPRCYVEYVPSAGNDEQATGENLNHVGRSQQISG
eukprot:CAMPEP_0116856548 /NCGR_PEP_ID=MMETSP0418-20121206/19981_1 /TAXON_ID=1158023 /ORGANISM="Astrosyne radiata, Strain 13vi08-1A" /LENGTH=449 /DNA_ID=CAMNT_0004489977 /DNA_START=2487 /DNA_END=3836 /DNA_ORIENTATION=-